MAGWEIRSNMHFSRQEKYGEVILTKQCTVLRNTGWYSANTMLTSLIPDQLQVCLLHNVLRRAVFQPDSWFLFHSLSLHVGTKRAVFRTAVLCTTRETLASGRQVGPQRGSRYQHCDSDCSLTASWFCAVIDNSDKQMQKLVQNASTVLGTSSNYATLSWYTHQSLQGIRQ